MLLHFRYPPWLVLLLSVVVTSGCSNAENHKKLIGSWSNEAGVFEGKSLPAGCIIFTFTDDKRFEWCISTRVGEMTSMCTTSTYSGRFSCRSKFLYLYFDEAIPGSPKKIQDELVFDGDNRISFGNNKGDRMQFVRIGAPQNGTPEDSSNGTLEAKAPDASAAPVAITEDERKKIEEESQKRNAEWDAKVAENRNHGSTSGEDSSNFGNPAETTPSLGQTEPTTNGKATSSFNSSSISDIKLDLSQKKDCVIPRSIKSINAMTQGNSSWNLSVEAMTPPKYPPIRPITLSIPKTESATFTKPDKLLLSGPEQGVSVVGWREDPFGKPKWAWINVVKLTQGTAITKKLLFEHTVQDISPSGKYLAITASIGEWPASRNGLVIFKIGDGSFKQMLLMTPFDDAPDNVRKRNKVTIDTVRWLDEKRVLLGSAQGAIVCMDISKSNLIYGITLNLFGGKFELTPDRKCIVVARNDQCIVFEANSGKQVGLILPQRNGENSEFLSENICFSSDGTFMACVSKDKTGVWDFVSGRYLASLPGGEIFSNNAWIGNQFIFAQNSLIDVRSGVSLVNYRSAPTAYASAGDSLAYMLQQDSAFSGDQQLSFTIANPVPSDLAEMHQKLQISNEQTMGPGDSISVSLAPDAKIPAGESEQILSHFSKVLRENGLNVVDGDGGDFKLTVTRSELSEPETLRYQEMFTGKRVEATFRCYTESWQITRNGTRIFGSSHSPYPHQPEDFDKSYQAQLDQEMRVSAEWFCSQSIPKVITKSMSGEVTKGVGIFSAEGIQFAQ